MSESQQIEKGGRDARTVSPPKRQRIEAESSENHHLSFQHLSTDLIWLVLSYVPSALPSKEKINAVPSDNSVDVKRQGMKNVCRSFVSLRRVSKRWRQVMSEDDIWKRLCQRDWNLEVAHASSGNALAPTIATQSDEENSASSLLTLVSVPTYKDAWKLYWLYNYRVYTGGEVVEAPLLQRTVSMWRKFERWVGANFGDTGVQLAEPADWTHFQLVEAKVERYLAPCLRAIYSVHNGQKFNFTGELSSLSDEERETYEYFQGLFGGFSVYTETHCCRMPSIGHALAMAQNNRYNGRSAGGPRFLAMGNIGRVFLINVETAEMGLDCATERGSRSFRLCFRNGQANPHQFLAWMETFGQNLEDGVYWKTEIVPTIPRTVGICLFPNKGPTVSVGRHRGVEIVSSAIFVPMIPESPFAYCIRIRLIPAGEDGHMSEQERGFESCQLISRHWEISESTGRVRHVNGDGVIGLYPVLYEGGYFEHSLGRFQAGWFIYQSLSGMIEGTHGSMKGHLQFVPGAVYNASGDPFNVPIAEFQLNYPDVLM